MFIFLMLFLGIFYLSIHSGLLPPWLVSVLQSIISKYVMTHVHIINEPVHEISNNVVCLTSKALDQPAHMCSLIRAFAKRLSFL